MRYFRHKVEAPEATIYPIVCMHVGAKQCDENFIKEHVERIAEDPNGRAVYMGDAGECNIRNSKGSIFEQTLTPGEQQVHAAELLEPIKNKLLFGISGNHGRRIDIETGLSWDETFCFRLGIPYLELAAFMRLDVGERTVSYDLYFHHGAGGSINMGGKVNKARKFEEIVEADAVFTAHTHICCEIPPTPRATIEPRANEGIVWKETHSYICGCAYDSRTGYAEERGYSPILPAYLGVTFNGKDKRKNKKKQRKRQAFRENVSKQQTCTIWRAGA